MSQPPATPSGAMRDVPQTDPTVGAARSLSPVPRTQQFKRLLWAAVEATLFRYSFHTFDHWRAFLLRLFGARIGKNAGIRRTSRIYYPWNLTLGCVSCLGDNVVVYNLAPITIGHRVTVSQEAYLCAGTHDYTRLSMPLVTLPVVLNDDVWICARAFVGPGVTVGQGAIVGACAVATSDVPDWAIVAGNPGRIVKTREKPV